MGCSARERDRERWRCSKEETAAEWVKERNEQKAHILFDNAFQFITIFGINWLLLQCEQMSVES